ncbi:MAG: redoxin domain-containing protein [Armatimonadia bacterium]|nr:redoxin domain-containing protein [Armatimonadia bacterium]
METILEWGDSLKVGVTEALATGSPMAYVFVFLAGILASLTPCVYPMIPVTIAVIGGQTKKGPKEGFFLSLCYSVGIALTYAIIGAGMAALGRVTERALGQGSLAQSPWVSLGIGIICLIFGLVMFGTINLPMPSGVQQWQSQRRGGNYIGAFLAGMVFGTVASPCLAPVVSVIAIELAKTGNILYGGGMLFTFGLGLGVLFLIIGTFSGALSSMPKAGEWMDKIKGAFAWLMLAIAVGYFFHAGSQYATAKIRKAEQQALQAAAAEGGETVSIGEAGPPPYTVAPADLAPLEHGAEPGAVAPDATLLASDNSKTSLSALWSERTLVMVFSAEWCKNCPEEVPHVNEAYAEYGEQAFFFEVGTTQPSGTTLAWADKHGVEYPLMFDSASGSSDGALLQAYHPEDPMGLPWTVVIARDGTLLYRDVSFPKNIGELIEEGNSREPSGAVAVPGADEPEPSDGDVAEPVDAGMDEDEVVTPGDGPYTLPEGTTVEPSDGEGERAPVVTLQDSEGQAFTLGDWRGQYGILLALYSGQAWEDTEEIEGVNAVAEAYPEWLKVLGFSGATSVEEAGTWAEENGVEHEVVFDPGDAARQAFSEGETREPRFVFIDLDGNILYQGEWPGEARAMELAATAAGE